MKRQLGLCFLLVAVAAPGALAQERVDQETVARIRQEAMENSQVMEHLFYMADVHGPRLAGSPNYMKAANWARETMEGWGLANSRLERWGNFGRGWVLKDFTLDLVEPSFHPLIGFPKAWVGSTDGTVTGETVIFQPRNAEEMQQFRGRLRNAIVLMEPERPVPPRFEPDGRRLSDEYLRSVDVAHGDTSTGAAPPTPAIQASQAESRRISAARPPGPSMDARLAFLREEGAAVVLEPSVASYGGQGTVRVGAGGSQAPNAEPGFPAIVVTPEHYNRLYRLTERGIPTRVRVNVETEFVAEDLDDYNVIAEIPGTDPALRDQIVMIGAHFDSWHSGTGATDNGSGSAVMMEVMRVLKTLDLPVRRTVRIGLWGAEERGLRGSAGHVRQHFGSADSPGPGFDNLSVYFNMDNGTGRIRGVWGQGNRAAAPIFQAWLQPFHDLDAQTVSVRTVGSTDHASFDRAGLPGFQFIQDRIAYQTRTHHTSMDVYDAILEDDLKQAVTIIASFVYHAATRDERFPRKGEETRR